jgi:hypothetical protein
VQLREELGRLLEVFLTRDPRVKGSVYELRRKCGKPTAAAPATAPSWCAGARQGAPACRTLTPSRRGDLRAAVRRYRHFRRARARLVKLHAEMLALIDALEARRREVP